MKGKYIQRRDGESQRYAVEFWRITPAGHRIAVLIDIKWIEGLKDYIKIHHDSSHLYL